MPRRKSGKTGRTGLSAKERRRQAEASGSSGTGSGGSGTRPNGSREGPSGSAAAIPQHAQPRPDFVQRAPVHIPDDKQQRIAHFRGRAADIPSIDMLAVQQLVHDAGLWEEAEQFHRDIIQQGLQKILHLLHPGAGRIPKDVQIDAVHALIFGQSDVLVVARTGEGKSLVFQAFAMLTGQVTLQIVPLNRLGIEQSDDIGRMNQFQGDSGKPIICSVAVTGDEKERNPHLYQEIAEGKYQHIIMGPEQAFHPGFRNLIGRPEVRNRIGLVAIRGTPRQQMERVPTGVRSAVRAAPDPAHRNRVAGGTLEDVRKATERKIQDGEATPDRIQKTMIFVDGRRYVQDAVDTIRKWLVALTKD